VGELPGRRRLDERIQQRLGLAGRVDSLQAIGARHGTDKAGGLLTIYETFLHPLREKEVAVLEIGVYRGASLRTWRDYFQYGRVYGIDIRPEAEVHADDRIKVFIGSQADTAFLNGVADESGPLDVIVDDGSHRAHDQIASLLHLWACVKPGGFYIVEDTHASYLSQFDMSYRNPASAIELLKGVVDDIHNQWHTHPTTLEHLEAAHFFNKTCLLRKQSPLKPRLVWPGVGKKTWDF
jgi:hypothetical protein